MSHILMQWPFLMEVRFRMLRKYQIKDIKPMAAAAHHAAAPLVTMATSPQMLWLNGCIPTQDDNVTCWPL
jgi:hypothetical protein